MTVEELCTYCELNDITPNEIYVLYRCLKKRKPLNVPATKCIRVLINKGFLKEEQNRIIPTESGITVLQVVGLLTSDEENTVKDYLSEYIALFPKGLLPSGTPARQNRKALENAFTWFHKTHGFGWPLILKATKSYVEHYEKNNYMYMKNSQYFIKKTQPDKTVVSELANWCSLIIAGYDETHIDPFSEKVV
jgi:hypothetical protein